MPISLNLIGREYGRLKVLRKDEERSRKNHIRWICECKCGKIKSILGSTLQAGGCNSCRCLQKDLQYKGYKDLSGSYWAMLQRNAKKRNLEFNLTIEQAWELYEKQSRKCFLTGRIITITKDFGRRKDNGHKQTASLDRIDNSLGYNINNVCWVYRNINYLKSTLNTKDFVHICKEVVEEQKKHNRFTEYAFVENIQTPLNKWY